MKTACCLLLFAFLLASVALACPAGKNRGQTERTPSSSSQKPGNVPPVPRFPPGKVSHLCDIRVHSAEALPGVS